MVKPLSFKGDKPKKRKHRTDDASNADPSRKTPKPSQSQPEQDADADQNTEDQSWVSADAPSDLAGPVLLVLPSETPTAIAADANGKVFASGLENTVDGDPGSAEPHDVRQVWVATRVAGTEGFSFRGCHGKYLSIDSHGLPSATASAISHHESFLIIPSPEIPGTFALQIHGGDKESFLSITDPADAGKSKSSGAVEIRGDATTLGFSSTLRIRMQARFKPRIKANKENRAMEKISRKELEGIVGRALEDGEVKRLRRARREGAFHEEVLDVRVKGKHDKFA